MPVIRRGAGVALAVAVAAALGGCGPTEAEAGLAVVLAAVPITLIAVALHALYAAGWRRLGVEVHPRARVTVALLVVLAAPAVIAPLRWSREIDDWFVTAFALVGTSYLTVLVVVVRLCAVEGLRAAYPWALVIAWVPLWPLAPYLAFAGSTEAELPDAIALLWLLPGYGGMIAGPVAAIAGLELLVRHLLARRRARAAVPG